MNRIASGLKNNLWVLFTVYFVAWAGYGILAMMMYLHWLVPIVAVGVVAGANHLWGLSLEVVFALFAAVMGVYGLAVKFGLAWYAALGLVLAPLPVLIVLSGVIHRLARRK